MKEVLRVGMLHPTFAMIDTEVEGQAITYTSGMVIGNAVSAQITWNRADTSHYGDDVEDARDNGILSGDISFVSSGITDAGRALMLGDEEVSTGEYEASTEASPYGGFGYIRVLRKDGETAYEGIWMHKVQFGENTVNDNTRGETIEWGETTLEGRISPVKNNASLKNRVMAHKFFEDLEDADEWLQGKANITTTTTNNQSVNG